MAGRICMNAGCGAASIGWRKGWALRSGELAILCDNCGLAFERMVFCDMFHCQHSGWRECNSCGKRLHCGCIVSKSLVELLDSGGVNCISCARSSGLFPIANDAKSNGSGILTHNNVGDRPSLPTENRINGNNDAKLKHTYLADVGDGFGIKNLLQSQNCDASGICGQMKQEARFQTLGENGSTDITNPPFNEPSRLGKLNVFRNDIYDSMSQTNLSITLGSPTINLHKGPVVAIEEREQAKAAFGIHHGPRSRQLLPKPIRSVVATGVDQNIDRVSQLRVARPPAEGRGRNQLLPRYWPRITDQELQQISGDSNSTIVPLFEKVLSASDAGRIGRLVLPKACAEAYFPPISQPEGLPLRIQDVKGKEWVFQFRFWPNNNSRMYVLEGVTPCIQSMQLQAGDTVTFSRLDPEEKLVMGFRKAVNPLGLQDSQLSVTPTGAHPSETFFSGVMENLPIVSGYSGLLQSLKASSDPHLRALTKQFNASGSAKLLKTEKHVERKGEGSLPLPIVSSEKKRSRNIGLKSKRLLIDSQDALDLRLTWEEAQGLLHPPPSTEANVVMIEEYEFEEYDEPPVFGKRSIFTVRASGGQEQWAQCDDCSKWRRLPVEIVLPPKWTCSDNASDHGRCSCSAPDELSPSEVDNLLRLNKEFKRQKTASNHRPTQEHESSSLDALANAAVIGENVSDPDVATVAATTKHPRHRPGCSCIVCIQPPSGKGKHKPTCTCNVCMTVKRRFKTLMMRKKKRQSERDEEIAQQNQHLSRLKDVEAEVDSLSKPTEDEARLAIEPESETQSNILPKKVDESGKVQLDLNCHPGRDEDLQVGETHLSMMSLLQVASLPLQTYLKQNGLSSLLSEHQATSGSSLPPQAAVETEEQPQEEHQLVSTAQGESRDEEACQQPDQGQTDPV